MKMLIKPEYFEQIKNGTKRVELRDAHITFENEKTGEKLIKNVIRARVIKNPGKIPGVIEDDKVISYWLG